MTQINVVPPDTSTPIKEIISLVALLLGSILISIGAFMALGLAYGLIVLGVLLVVVSVLFGLNR